MRGKKELAGNFCSFKSKKFTLIFLNVLKVKRNYRNLKK
jgi:hypothetical protein